LKTKLA